MSRSPVLSTSTVRSDRPAFSSMSSSGVMISPAIGASCGASVPGPIGLNTTIIFVPSAKHPSTEITPIMPATPGITSSVVRSRPAMSTMASVGHVPPRRREHLVGDQGHRLGMAQLDAESPVATGKLGRGEDGQALELRGRQIHHG
jgi:hypothetical protein